jgi:CHAT domain-containing protein
MTDVDFNVHVDDRGVVYASSNGGKIRGKLKIDKDKVEDLLRKVTDRNQNTSDILEKLGQELFNSLFVNEKYSPEDPKSISNEFWYYYPNALKGKDHLKIILQLDNTYAQSLPWELLHDGQYYLGPQNGVSIVRLPLGVNPETETKKIEDKLNILVLLCNPKGTEKLAWAKKEKDEIERVFKTKLGENKVNIDVLSTELEDEDKKPWMNNIINRINKTSYHIIHYIGHSSFEGGKGQIHLSDNLGEVMFYKDTDFSGIFQGQNRENLGLVLLNSCESGVERGFHGLARQLIERGIPCVVAMQFRILDRVGPDLAREFYENFIDSAYAPETATDYSRQKIYTFIGGPDTREFAALVLYLATKGKEIFNGIIKERPDGPPPPQSLLEKIKILIDRHDNFLVMNRMSIEEFCMAEKNGLVQVLIALSDSADDIKLEYEDKQIIRQMLEIVPDRMRILQDLSVSATKKAQTEAYLRQIIRKFITKPCKEILDKEETVSR